MTQKKYLLALEHALPNKDTSLSLMLLKNISQFIDRNQLIEKSLLKEKHPLHACCPQCLKAHLIAKAREYHLPKEDTEKLIKKIKGPIGHQGYYLDAGTLINLREQ